jgi:metallo-beta-lactamase class B
MIRTDTLGTMRLALLVFACAILILSPGAFGQSASTPANPEWIKPLPPFRMIGNVYWVGTYDLSTYLITTPRGHILINNGLLQTVPQIKTGVEQLGFKLADVKIITATHGHFDHVAGLAELKRMTGARVMMSEQDAELLESGGKSDFRFGDDPAARFEPAKVDRRLKDGDKIELGNVILTTHHHPGHTKGATSFTFEVRENNQTYRVGIMNMPSINPGVRVSGMPKFPDITQAYARTFHDQKEIRIDVWLASHAAQFDMHKKYQQGDAYDPNRFVDPDGFQKAVARLEGVYLNQLANERREK